MNDDPYTPLWHACKDGNVQKIKIIMEHHDVSDLAKKCPDGTSPLTIAFIKGRQNVLDYLKHRYQLKVQMEDVTNLDNKETLLTKLTLKYPVFNEEVESKHSMMLSLGQSALKMEDMKKFILGDLCPFREFMKQSADIAYVCAITPSTCAYDCQRKDECEKARDLLKVMQLIELEWNNRNNNRLSPKFILVGSIIEGTRIGHAGELDLTVTFEGLNDNPFHLGKDAFTLEIRDENHPMKEYCTEEGILDYSPFFSDMLDEIESCIATQSDVISKETNHRITIPQRPMHEDLSLIREYDPKLGTFYQHSNEHLFPVTHTKIGACLIFEWKGSEILTVDLIPVLPVEGSSIKRLFESVTQTLMRRPHPPNWLKYLKGCITKDMILPQSYKRNFEEIPDEPINVSMKLLHYAEGPCNFIIKPMQLLGVTSEFRSHPELKEVYCYIKCLKTFLDVNINSYFIKKVLLSDEAKKALKEDSTTENIHTVLHNPDIRPYFKNVIGYYKYQEPQTEIPLDKGEQALIKAAEIGDLDEVKRLIGTGCRVDERINTEIGYNALICASQQGYFKVVKCLVEEGKADVMMKDLLGCSALLRATSHNQLAIAKYLLDLEPSLVHEADLNGRSPLYQACYEGHIDMTQLLLMNGADVEQKGGKFGSTPLIMASQRGNLSTIQLLLDKSQVNINGVDDKGRTAVFMAAMKGHLEVIRYLREKGADITKAAHSGSTPLQSAMENHHSDVINYIKSYH